MTDVGLTTWVGRWLTRRGRLGKLHKAMAPSRRFRQRVKKEMLRSERTQSPLTLVIFDVRGPAARGDRLEEGLERLASIVLGRLRETDSVGWHREGGRQSVGVILHHTVPEDARRMIDDVRHRFQAAGGNAKGHLLLLGCEIYAYPHEHEVGDSGIEQLWLFCEETLAGVEPNGLEEPPFEDPVTMVAM